MSPRTRRLVLWISTPVVAFAIVGGYLTRVTAKEGTYQYLRIFDEVVGLITGNYVEPVDVDRVMAGAMHGLADSLDSDSAYLDANQVKQLESTTPTPAGDVGLDLTRQYYLRIIAARDGSPAARAGIRTGDYLRLIGDTPTREMSVFEGLRRLRGIPGSKISITVMRGNTNEPHVIELTREAAPAVEVSARMAAPAVGYLRIAAVSARTPEQARARLAELAKGGASRLIVDVRRASGGSLDGGLALARLFLGSGTLAIRETKGVAPETIIARAGDGSVTLPTTLLVDTGTSGAAELFASALVGNNRAELIGEHTMGRAGLQRLVKLPNGSGLWLTTTRFLTPDGSPLHMKGLEPTVAVDEPDVDFGQPPPSDDPILERALQQVADKKAA